MKKVILTVVFIMIISIRVSAENSALLPGDSVYASQEKQEEIATEVSEDFLADLKRNKIVALKESLTPVYFIDPVECLEKGEITIRPGDYQLKSEDDISVLSNGILSPILKSSEEDTNIYVAKLVKYNNDNYPACMLVCFDDFGNIKYETLMWNFWTQTSYADLKSEIDIIAAKIGIDSIEEKDLRYVRICGIYTDNVEYFDYGSAFYYYNGETEILFAVNSSDWLFSEKTYLIGEEIIKRFQFLKEKRTDEIEFTEKYKSEKFRNGNSLWYYDFESEYNDFMRRTFIESPINVIHINEYLSDGIYISSMPEQSQVIGEIGEITPEGLPEHTVSETS